MVRCIVNDCDGATDFQSGDRFIELAEREGRKLPGPGLYNPQNAGIYAVPGGRFNVSRPKTHWDLIERHGTPVCHAAVLCARS
jgi:hypothetical protein